MSEITTAEATEAEARERADKIRATADQLCLLLYQAHQAKDWKALGYSSWGQYIDTEHNMSRSRSYQLLKQAGIINSAVAALGMVSTDVDTGAVGRAITEAAARQLAGWDDELQFRLRFIPREDDEDDQTFAARIVTGLREDVGRDLEAIAANSNQVAGSIDYTTDPDPGDAEPIQIMWTCMKLIYGDDWDDFLANYQPKPVTATDVCRWLAYTRIPRPVWNGLLHDLALHPQLISPPS